MQEEVIDLLSFSSVLRKCYTCRCRHPETASSVLQGPENDYGDYDYLIEEIPSSGAKWSWWYEKCDNCGKEHKLNYVFTGCFRTMDGWDSQSDCECWKCHLKRKITEPFKKFKRKIKKQIQ